MRIAFPSLLLAGTLLLAGMKTGPTAAAADLYVAPQGNDVNPGTVERPLATLECARDAIRKLHAGGASPAGPITVWLARGDYRRTASFQLTKEDSGTSESPIVYRAVEPLGARLLTGRALAATDFKPVTEPSLLSRLAPEARGKVVQLDLAALHLTHAQPFPATFHGGGNLFELFCNRQRMGLARWPTTGYTTLAKVVERGDGTPAHPGTFVYRAERPGHWLVDGNIWLDGYWVVPWQSDVVQVARIDPATKQITLVATPPRGVGSKYAGPSGSGKENWYAFNVLEELNVPGQWCVDFKSQTLFFWPPAPLTGMEILLSDLATPLVELTDVSHVTFRGLVFEAGLGDGITIAGGSDDLLAGCTLRNLGGKGVVVKGGVHHGVLSCDLYALGQGGIYLSGGERKSLTPAGHFAVNNDIHHVGVRQRTYAPPISVGAYDAPSAVGCRIAHNLLHDVPHAGVLYGGNDHVLEYNEVCRVALDSGDVGAFYTWHDWTSRGNVVRYNFVHDSPGVNAFYMDDGDSGDTIFGNVVYQTIYGPFIGGGHDNIVRNNLIIDCEKGIHIDARGVSRGYNLQNKGMVAAVNAVHYQQPPWSTRYPEMHNLLDFHPELPTGNVIEHNVTVHCKIGLHLGGKKEELQYSTIRDNLDLPDDALGFADVAQRNFTLSPNSPLYTKLPGFEPIPFEKIGLFVDEYRTTLPQGVRQGAAAGGPGHFDSLTDVQHENQRHQANHP